MQTPMPNPTPQTEETKKTSAPFVSAARRFFTAWWALLLCGSLVLTFVTVALTQFERRNHGDLVIVLDPGHGGADTGAVNRARGLIESEINLRIALACRDRLQEYRGVRVYMTHTGVKNRFGKSSLSRRVSVAQAVGADIFISLHINSAENKTANGVEIYVPITRHERRYNEDCTRLAESIIDRFVAMGLNSRGVKTRQSGGNRVYTFDDGTTEPGDYYYVVGEPISRMGIPGILVEHAFIDGDADFLSDDANLEALGVADAEAIAAHFGLHRRDEAPVVSGSMDFGSSQPGGTVSSEPSSDTPSAASSDSTPSDTASVPYTSEEDDRTAVARVEALIRALPEAPTEDDGSRIKAARSAYNELGARQQNQVDKQLYQKYCDVITAYEELTHPIRIAVKQGSALTIDRVNGQIRNAGTAAQGGNGRVTVFSIMVELDLALAPGVSPSYRDEGVLEYRVIAPSGRRLKSDDELPDNAVISIVYEDAVLDSLTIRLAP